jgi:hypothetical protein
MQLVKDAFLMQSPPLPPDTIRRCLSPNSSCPVCLPPSSQESTC